MLRYTRRFYCYCKCNSKFKNNKIKKRPMDKESWSFGLTNQIWLIMLKFKEKNEYFSDNEVFDYWSYD